MLYQRRSTTFELMSLDDGASGSGGGASSGDATTAAGGDSVTRKHRRRSHRLSAGSTGAAGSGYNDPFEESRIIGNQRRSSALLEVNEDGKHGGSQYRNRRSAEYTSRHKNKGTDVNLVDSNIVEVVLDSELNGNIKAPSSSLVQSRVYLHPGVYDYGATTSAASSPSTTSRRFADPTAATTTISEMIADDYVNEDDDSFAIFCNEFENERKIESKYGQKKKNRRVPSRHEAKKAEGQRSGSESETNLLGENGQSRNSESESNDDDDSNASSFVDEQLDEAEQYEMGDRLGELLPLNYGRRSRREGIASLARQAQLGSWDGGDYSTNITEQSPLEFSSISENESKSLGDVDSDEQSGIRKYAKLILPHVGLVVLTCAYTLIGASIFYSIENPNELATKRHQLNLIYAHQSEFVASLLRLAAASGQRAADALPSRDNWTELAHAHMHAMSDHLFVAFDKYFLTSTEVKQNITKEIWTFSTALFFSVTVVTTIGYGNPVPVTQLGRLMCIGFSLFGIPLTLVTIADMGKFLSERLIWAYGKYLLMKYFLCERLSLRKRYRKQSQAAAARFKFKERQEHVCDDCQHRGLTQHMHVIEEQRIPALLVFGILVLYTALGGVLMSFLEPWSFFTSFYWSFITMTTVGFGDLMPRRDQYMYFILLYIILGLAITTMCIDLVGVQYIRKIHYFGRKIQDARSALAVVGGKVVLVSELYANLMQKRARSSMRDAFIIENLYVSKHIIPFIPSDIRFIRYIDDHRHHHHHGQLTRRRSQGSIVRMASIEDGLSSISTTTVSSLRDLSSCRFCHSRFSISNQK